MLSFIDIVILVMALGGLARGWSRGLTRCLGSVAALVVAVVASRLFMHDHGLGGALLVFAAAWVAVTLLARLLHKAAKAVFLGPIDRLAGALWLCGAYIVGLSMLMNAYAWLHSLKDHAQPIWQDDAWARLVLDIFPWLTGQAGIDFSSHLQTVTAAAAL